MSYIDLESLRDNSRELHDLPAVPKKQAPGEEVASTNKDRSYSSFYTEESSKRDTKPGEPPASRRSSYVLSCESGVMQLVLQSSAPELVGHARQPPYNAKLGSSRRQLEVEDVENEDETIAAASSRDSMRVRRSSATVLPWTSHLADESPQSAPASRRSSDDRAVRGGVTMGAKTEQHSYSSFKKMGVHTPDSFRKRHPKLSADAAERLSAQQQLRVMQGGFAGGMR